MRGRDKLKRIKRGPRLPSTAVKRTMQNLRMGANYGLHLFGETLAEQAAATRMSVFSVGAARVWRQASREDPYGVRSRDWCMYSRTPLIMEIWTYIMYSIHVP